MILLLDSTVLIDLLRERRRRADGLDALLDEGYELTTSAINVGEVYSGLRPAEEARASTLLDYVVVLPVTTEIARSAGQLRYRWARQGRTLGMSDMIVAATALEYNLTLMTDNRKDFPMPELKLFDLP